MEVGDKIRVFLYCNYRRMPGKTKDYVIEKFRDCLGIFESGAHRQAGRFTPLCELYEPGPESEKKYISNYGEYYTNMVQAWMDIP